MYNSMNAKPMEKVCIGCIEANETLRLGANFKVATEYGKCDCCGRMHHVIPFRRFFKENTPIKPYTPKEVPNLDEVNKAIELLSGELAEHKAARQEDAKNIQQQGEVISKLENEVSRMLEMKSPQPISTKVANPPKKIEPAKNTQEVYE